MSNEQSNRRNGNQKSPSQRSTKKRSSKSESRSAEAGQEHVSEENRISVSTVNPNFPKGEQQGEDVVDNNPFAQKSDGVLPDRHEYDSEEKAVLSRKAAINPNVPNGIAYDKDGNKIDYTNTVPNPSKLSTTVSPLGREDARKGEVVPAPPAGKEATSELTIENPERGGIKMKITRHAWEQMKQGSTSGWRESSPEEPSEVTELKNKKKSTSNGKKGKAA